MKKLYYISFVLLVSVLLYSCKEKAPEITDAKDIEYDEFSTSRFPEFDANLEVSIYLMLPKTNGNEFLDSIYSDLVAYYTDSSKREIQSGIEIFADSIESEYYTNKEDIGADISGYIYAVNYYDSANCLCITTIPTNIRVGRMASRERHTRFTTLQPAVASPRTTSL